MCWGCDANYGENRTEGSEKMGAGSPHPQKRRGSILRPPTSQGCQTNILRDNNKLHIPPSTKRRVAMESRASLSSRCSTSSTLPHTFHTRDPRGTIISARNLFTNQHQSSLLDTVSPPRLDHFDLPPPHSPPFPISPLLVLQRVVASPSSPTPANPEHGSPVSSRSRS